VFMQDEENPEEGIRRQIATWQNRADMAKAQGNEELVRQALARKRQYENALARFQEFNISED
jgi:phage shock protein A